jgi:hypothetical protein
MRSAGGIDIGAMLQAAYELIDGFGAQRIADRPLSASRREGAARPARDR